MPVIRLVARPLGEPVTLLCCGVDTLDLGVSTIRNIAGYTFLEKLLQLRGQARTKRAEVEFPDPNHPGRVYPTGGKPMYDLHVHADGLGEVYWRTGDPIEGTPDIFVSLASQCLWLGGGVAVVVARLEAWLEGLGFHVRSVKPSRCDVAMDLLVPGGLSQDWLDQHLCTQAQGDSAKRVRQVLTGFTIGSRESPIFVRIYDKTREIHEQSQNVNGGPISGHETEPHGRPWRSKIRPVLLSENRLR